MPIVHRPPKLLRPGVLKRTVLLVDRGLEVRRIVPVKLAMEIDEPWMTSDGHLCYGVQHVEGPAARAEALTLVGFKARACAYAALLLTPDKRRYLYEYVMSLDDILKHARTVPLTDFERDRAELFDLLQDGDRAGLLGVRQRKDSLLELADGTSYMDRA